MSGQARERQVELRQRLAAEDEARLSVAWARAQFARGDHRLAVAHLERLAAPHPLVTAALSLLRSGRMPPDAEDESLYARDTAITHPDTE